MLRAFLLQTCIVLLTTSIFVSSALGGILEVSGDIEIVSPPESVALGRLEDDSLIRLFAEQQGAFLEESLRVDIQNPGSVAARADLSPGTVVGRTVNSYLVHADPLGRGHPSKEYEARIRFEERILGILVDGKTLDASDPILGAVETAYIPRDRYRGFEGPGFPAAGSAIDDLLELSPDLRSVSLRLMTTSQLDQVRIITESLEGVDNSTVPEPSTLLLLAFALLLTPSAHRGRSSTLFSL